MNPIAGGLIAVLVIIVNLSGLFRILPSLEYLWKDWTGIGWFRLNWNETVSAIIGTIYMILIVGALIALLRNRSQQ